MCDITIWNLNGEIYKIINVTNLTVTYNDLQYIFSNLSETLYFKIILNKKIIYHNLYNQKYEPDYNEREELTLETNLNIIFMNFNKNIINEIVENINDFDNIYNSNSLLQDNCDAILTSFFKIEETDKANGDDIIVRTFKNNIQFMKYVITYNAEFMNYASTELKDNEDFIIFAVSHHRYAFAYASDRLKDNEDIVKIALSHKGYVLKYVSDRLKDNEEIVRIALSYDVTDFLHISYRLKDNDDIVRLAVWRNPFALKYASYRLTDNKNIVKIAVRQDPLASLYASERLKLNDYKDIVKNVISRTH